MMMLLKTTKITQQTQKLSIPDKSSTYTFYRSTGGWFIVRDVITSGDCFCVRGGRGEWVTTTNTDSEPKGRDRCEAAFCILKPAPSTFIILLHTTSGIANKSCFKNCKVGKNGPVSWTFVYSLIRWMNEDTWIEKTGHNLILTLFNIIHLD